MKAVLLALLLVVPLPGPVRDGESVFDTYTCTTDTDCYERFGDPDEWEGDTCAETDEGCPGDVWCFDQWTTVEACPEAVL